MEEKEFTTIYPNKEKKRGKKVALCILYVVLALAIVFIGISIAFHQKYTYISINGKSMQSTLNPNPVMQTIEENGIKRDIWVQDGVYVENTSESDYGDMVIIKGVLVDKTKTVVKRALAYGGDYISIAKVEVEDDLFEFRFMRIKAGTTEVEVLEEEYIKSHWEWAMYYSPTEAQMPQCSETANIVYEIEFYEEFAGGGYESSLFAVEQVQGAQVKFFKVPEGDVFYMGDNRTNSTDARSLGTADIEQITGKVVQVVRDGTYYDGNIFFFFNRIGGFFSVLWQEILRFFGAKV